MSIRKLTALDFGYVRKLPVQLAHPAANTLSPKKLRLMMQDNNIRLLVYVTEKGVAAFMSLNFIPDVSNPVNFMVVTYFAIDRFVMSLGIATEMEENAIGLALAHHSTALLIRTGHLSAPALRFYEERGYTISAGSLMKKLENK